MVQTKIFLQYKDYALEMCGSTIFYGSMTKMMKNDSCKIMLWYSVYLAQKHSFKQDKESIVAKYIFLNVRVQKCNKKEKTIWETM